MNDVIAMMEIKLENIMEKIQGEEEALDYHIRSVERCRSKIEDLNNFMNQLHNSIRALKEVENELNPTRLEGSD